MAEINTDSNDSQTTHERFSRNRGRGSGSKNRDTFYKHSDRRNCEASNSRDSSNKSNRAGSYGGGEF